MQTVRRNQVNSLRNITRTAERSIEKKTGMRVSLIAHTDHRFARTPERMMNIIAATLDMNADTYMVKSRKREIVELRFLAAYLLRSYFPTITLQQISMLFGGQDHTSIMNGLVRARTLLEINDEIFSHKYLLALAAVNQWLSNDTEYGSAICA